MLAEEMDDLKQSQKEISNSFAQCQVSRFKEINFKNYFDSRDLFSKIVTSSV